MALSFAPSARRSAFVEGSSLLSVGGISTREPLNLQKPPHPLLPPLRALLASLGLPSSLAPSSLALATPSLLLAILEALLETRIADVQDEWRGSWTRDHRRGVVEVLVRAIGEVALGLTGAGRGGEAEQRLGRWRAEEVDVELVVRGREGAVAKLVQGLLDIAESMGVYVPAPAQSTPADGVKKSALFPPFVPPTMSPASSPFVEDTSSATPTPSLFAPRPLRPSRPVSSTSRSSAPSAALRSSSSTSASTSLTVPTHSHSHPRPLSRSTTSTTSRSSRSSTSTSTASTARPASFLSELASSPPPLSPRRRPRSRARTADGGDETREVSWETGSGSTGGRSTLERLRRAAEAGVEERRQAEREREERAQEEERRREKAKGKGKARQEDEEDPFAASPSSASAAEDEGETPCCDDCGASLLLRRAPRRKWQRLRGTEEAASGDEASSSSSFDPSAGESSAEGSTSPSHHPLRARHRAQRERREAVPPCTCTCAPPPPRPPGKRRAKRPPATICNPATLNVNQLPPASTPAPTSAPRRRIRIVRPASSRPSTTLPSSSIPTSATPPRASLIDEGAPDDLVLSAVELSIHGESEIEAFERAHGQGQVEGEVGGAAAEGAGPEDRDWGGRRGRGGGVGGVERRRG
ncbi:hypothetical protein JCM8097_004570 [Rhodosporidiobolus ruineniae]